MVAIRIPTNPLLFPMVLLIVSLIAIASAVISISIVAINVPFAVYKTLKEVYVKHAE